MKNPTRPEKEDTFLKGGAGAGFIKTSMIMGKSRLYGMILKMAWGYRKTFFYLLRKRGLKAAFNFIYLKLFVPAGEGAGGAFYLIFGSLIRKFPHLAPYPRYIEVEISTICDLKCPMCEHTYFKDQVQRNITFEEFRHIVDQFPKLRWINATGEGTAFLNKDYLNMLEYLKKKEVMVFLVDYFGKIDEPTGRRLIEMGVDGIYISLDAETKKTYERIRVGANFDSVVSNIRRFVELKREYKSVTPELCFRYIIQTENLEETPGVLDLISTFGRKSDFGDGSHIDFTGLLDFKEIRHLVVNKVEDRIIESIMEKNKKYNYNILFQHIDVGSRKNLNPPLDYCLCWMEPYIMMGGYVLPCCSILMSNQRTFLREHSFGNMFEKHFKDIWYSDRYKEFRAAINDPTQPVPRFCLGCRAYDTAARAKKYGVDKEL